MPFFFSNTKSLNRGMKPTRFLQETWFLVGQGRAFALNSLRPCAIIRLRLRPFGHAQGRPEPVEGRRGRVRRCA